MINLFCNDSQRLFDVIIYGPMIISGPIVISCGIIYVLWLFSPVALVGMIVFLSFYPCQVRTTLQRRAFIAFTKSKLICNVIYRIY